MSPTLAYRIVARAEAVTWALLLLGMFLKYGPVGNEMGVRVFGMVHGVVFIAYCLVTGVLWVDRRWSFGRFVAGIACAVPPFATVPFEIAVERRGLLGDTWRLRDVDPTGPLEPLVAWIVRRPGQGAAAGALAVCLLTGVALLVGPPVG